MAYTSWVCIRRRLWNINSDLLAEFYNRFAGRSALLAYAAEKKIPVQQMAAKPWSTG
jgi:argininosuccinate synthase